MNYEGYYLLFFIFIGLLLVIYYYNIQQAGLAEQQMLLQAQQKQQQRSNASDQLANTKNIANANEDHLKIYKKINNPDSYTYKIDNIDILNDNPSNNNKLGSPSNDSCDPELDEVYNTTLRGDENHSNKPDEVYTYSIKPNKSDLPIVNPPLQLLKNNAPLRLSERHFL
jgi:hypothetical protein